MKNKTTKNREKMRKESVTEQALLLAALYALAAFFALLLFAAGERTKTELSMTDYTTSPAALLPSKFELVLGRMVSGHPMTAMTPYLAKQDRKTATFLVSIAKQESNWGEHSPKQPDGRECYNYWGYRGQTDDMTPSGYSCFRSPKEAVSVVGGRLNTLIWNYQLDTPRELLVWKCGSSCTGHDPSDVATWQQTVGMYSKKIESETSL